MLNKMKRWIDKNPGPAVAWALTLSVGAGAVSAFKYLPAGPTLEEVAKQGLLSKEQEEVRQQLERLCSISDQIPSIEGSHHVPDNIQLVINESTNPPTYIVNIDGNGGYSIPVPEVYDPKEPLDAKHKEHIIVRYIKEEQKIVDDLLREKIDYFISASINPKTSNINCAF